MTYGGPPLGTPVLNLAESHRCRSKEDPDRRKAAERECFRIIHDMWPAYTNSPDKPLRMAWAKFLDHYLPGWKARSAIHNGDLSWDYDEEHR